MSKNISYFLLITMSIALMACPAVNRWSQEKMDSFEADCHSKTSFHVSSVGLLGFYSSELDTVIVLEKLNGQTLDTLIFHPITEEFEDKFRMVWIKPDTTFNISSSYHFCIGNSKPYILDNLETALLPEPTMFEDGYGCYMSNYSIDSVFYANRRNIEIKKRNIDK
ncbi:MAG: hypothetical protein ACI9N1_001711 [Flavobacteriales bacterium]|jgi:hypothetical protein